MTEDHGTARTLGDIIDAAKDGEPTTHDECLYALLAMSALHYFASASMQRLKEYPASTVITLDGEIEEDFRRVKMALGKPPREFVGWKNDPKNPDYQRFRAIGKKVIDKVVNGGK